MSHLNCCQFCLCSGLIPSSVSPVRFLAAYGLGPGLADGCSQLLCRVESCQLLVMNVSLSVPGYGSAGSYPGLNGTKYKCVSQPQPRPPPSNPLLQRGDKNRRKVLLRESDHTLPHPMLWFLFKWQRQQRFTSEKKRVANDLKPEGYIEEEQITHCFL